MSFRQIRVWLNTTFQESWSVWSKYYSSVKLFQIWIRMIKMGRNPKQLLATKTSHLFNTLVKRNLIKMCRKLCLTELWYSVKWALSWIWFVLKSFKSLALGIPNCWVQWIQGNELRKLLNLTKTFRLEFSFWRLLWEVLVWPLLARMSSFLRNMIGIRWMICRRWIELIVLAKHAQWTYLDSSWKTR